MRPYALRLGGMLFVLSLISCISGCARSTTPPPDSDTGTTSGAPGWNIEGRMDDRGGSLEERERQLPHSDVRPEGQPPLETEASMNRDDFMSQDVHFAFNSFTLSEGAKGLLEKKAQWLSANPEIAAQIEGHCDERGTIAYNLALGERRANAARQYLIGLGISPSRLTSISYGEEFPLDPGHDEAAWARNRRAHFAILNP